MNVPTLACCDERRRDLVQTSKYFGLDYLEVSPDQLTLTVCFLGRAPKEILPAQLVISGGERITAIDVTSVQVERAEDDELDDSMTVTVDQPGDFSTYCLCVRSLDEYGRPTGTPPKDFDPRYACVEFSFKASCPSDLDCKATPACEPPARFEPEINYLAKDYDSFRQLLFDRLAVIMPGWQERHVPDGGVALVELLAYVGDQLSYYQDAVATEAYLGTARQRISVRRHARLVDYAMHEGCNARAWVCLQTDINFPLDPTNIAFLTGLEQTPALAAKTLLRWEDLRNIPGSAYEIFEPLVADRTAAIEIYAAHGEIKFYTWGDKLCCLPAGTTKATLLDAWKPEDPPPQPSPEPQPPAPQPDGPSVLKSNAAEHVTKPARQLQLHEGDVLIFEEVKGPHTGNPADADPAKRWAVRLTEVTPVEDPLITTSDGRPTPLVNISWTAADALPFAFCLSVRLPAPDCRIICDLSVVHGNVILVDHGQTVPPEDLKPVEKTGETGCCACEGSVIELTSIAGRYRPKLQQSPLTWSDCDHLDRPASKMLAQDPRQAKPSIQLQSIPGAPNGSSPLFTQDQLENPAELAGALLQHADATTQFLYGRLSQDNKAALAQWNDNGDPPADLVKALEADLNDLLETWLPQRDLLESGPDDSQFVVEVDDAIVAHLRFGDGYCGRQPEAGMDFLATYRVGNGVAGNVGADRITKLAFKSGFVDGPTVTIRNPLPAAGGTNPEPMAEVKLFAPGAFRKVLERAITAADYATLAGRNHQLQNANAVLRWTGSWYEARVAVDPLGSESPDELLLRGVQRHLRPFRRLGQDLAVNGANYVPLQITLDVCVLPQYLRGHVEAALRDVFSNRRLAGGKLGFFHPDRLSFGDGIYLSQFIAAAQAVPGVQSVEIATFQRLYDPPGNELASGLLALAPSEIARLDNDPNYPEHGSLTLNLRGGR